MVGLGDGLGGSLGATHGRNPPPKGVITRPSLAFGTLCEETLIKQCTVS